MAYGFAPRTMAAAFTPECANPLSATDYKMPQSVVKAFKVRGGCEGGGKGYLGKDDCAFTLSTTQDQQVFIPPYVVRRLTPIECERLQGFPDNYTQIPYKKKPADQCPDGPRYKALGNSMATNVMRWIGEQIQKAIDYKT